MTKEMTQIADYTINTELLLSEYFTKENVQKILKIFSRQCDDLETAQFEIRDEFWIDTAEGVQLDVLGKIQGITRDGRNDTDYRVIIKTKIVINNGSGEFETIIQALTGLFGATLVILKNVGNATLSVSADISLTLSEFTILLDLFAAGVGVIFKEITANPFQFDTPNQGLGIPTVPGNLPDNTAIGGNLAAVLST